MSELLGGIASASDEQAQGVNQINSGVSDLDTVTQQNAGNAEELSAAAEQMAAQVGSFREVVALFRLRTEASEPGVEEPEPLAKAA